MMPGMNAGQMAGMMKKMGIAQSQLPVKKVIFEMADGRLVIEDPSVLQIKMQGQVTYQVTGEAVEEEDESFSDEDVKMVVSQSGKSESEARTALEEADGDIAEAIMTLKE
jgi:nascent polypeptide-associated complex subunit alpha